MFFDCGVLKYKKHIICFSESCWAFVAVGSVEGINYIECGSPLLDLSVQELVDNDPLSNGCVSGRPYFALEYILKNGITCDIDYPYVVDEGTRETDEMSRRKNQVVK
jgi:KDEL-tailed cysteine endopeptidase